MRATTIILVLLGAIALSAALYWLSGGHLIVFALPLALVGPVVWSRRRS